MNDLEALGWALAAAALLPAVVVAVLLYLGKLFDVTEGMSGE